MNGESLKVVMMMRGERKWEGCRAARSASAGFADGRFDDRMGEIVV